MIGRREPSRLAAPTKPREIRGTRLAPLVLVHRYISAAVNSDDVPQSNLGGRAMETERGSYPGTPTTRAAGDPLTTEQSGTVGRGVETGVERAGVLVKDAVDKTREKVAEYRDKGFEQVSKDVAEYTRSQPVPALLIAAGIGLVLGMLFGVGRR
jgi:ElaB/YqjD/DUF883 family membrane-anchored ribosome-binding protein